MPDRVRECLNCNARLTPEDPVRCNGCREGLPLRRCRSVHPEDGVRCDEHEQHPWAHGWYPTIGGRRPWPRTEDERPGLQHTLFD